MLHSRCGLTDQDCLGQLLVSPRQQNLLRIRMVDGGGDGVKESGVIVAPLSLISYNTPVFWYNSVYSA